MTDYKIDRIFPYPFFQTNIGRAITKEEINVVESMYPSRVKNSGNTTSKDSYILNHSFPDIKDFIMKNLDIFKREVIVPRFELDLYITQSWINWTEYTQYHHEHNHSNSYLSGVFYFDADDDKINLRSPKPKFVSVPYTQKNEFNAIMHTCHVNTGDLIIFPSELYHHVDLVKSEKRRTSMAFNVFVKGSLGMTSRLSKLVL
jgi:uncharacterized protein (TIGR02466 family)